MRPPRAIFFDAGDTLVHPAPSLAAVAERVLTQLAPEVLPLDTQALAQHIEQRTLTQRRQGQLVHYPADVARQFWQATYREFLHERLGTERAAQAADALLAAYTDLANWTLFPDAPATLTTLRPLVGSLGILSNWEDWLDELLLSLKIHTVFDHVLVSGRLGLEKPNPAIFRLALEQAGVAAAECVYVGDSLHHDIEPCRALGIRAILIDRTNRYAAPAATLPGCERLTDLRRLPALLGLADAPNQA